MFEKPFWSLGFRPFYLGGALFGAILIPLWLLHLTGNIPINGPFSGAYWHTHEVIFGFATAILTGFLFTAVRNWTGRPTPTGAHLAALFMIWLFARILLIIGPPAAASLVDLAYLPLMGLGIGIPIYKSQNRRNYQILAIIGLLFLINLYFHAKAWGIIDFGPEPTLVTGLNLFAVLITLVAGRVMPMFINNAAPGANAGRVVWVETIIMPGMLLLFLAEALRSTFPDIFENSVISNSYMGFLICLTLLHLIRLVKWNPHKTLADPMLWIMPLSYFWLIASVAFRAANLYNSDIDAIISTHLLGIGAMGGMMLAMMTRSALGHSGHEIKVSKIELACFVLIQIAVIARISSIFISTEYYLIMLQVSAAGWASAFGLFALRYGPIVIKPRF